MDGEIGMEHGPGPPCQPFTPGFKIPAPQDRTPLCVEAWTAALSGHPGQDDVAFVLSVLKNGAVVGYEGDRDMQLVTPNLGSTSSSPEFVDGYLQGEVEAGRVLGPFASPPWIHFRTSPIGLVPKDGSSFRLINHLSFGKANSVNGSINKMECGLGSFDEAVALIKQAGPKCKLLKVDVKAAFRLIPVRSEDIPLLGVTWNGQYYFDACLPFGLRSSPAIWERFSRMLRWLLENVAGCQFVTHYVDDFLVVIPADQDAEAIKTRVLAIFCRLGVPVSLSKLVGPTVNLEFLGHELNTVAMTCQVSPEKKVAALQLIQELSERDYIGRKELQSLLGKLYFLTRVIRQGRAFLGRALGLLKGKQHRSVFRITAAMKADMAWWLTFLPKWAGTALAIDDEWVAASTLHLYTDASELGAGGYFAGQWFSHAWTADELSAAKRSKRASLPYLELLAVGHAIATWGYLLHGQQVLLHSDNTAAVAGWNSLYSRDDKMLALIRAIVALTIEHQFVLRLRYVKSADNIFADPLSRLNIPLFQDRCPKAAQSPCTMIPLQING